MRIHLAVNLERADASTDMRAVRDHTIAMVRDAEAGGFETAWAAEHHAIELTIAPNPFQILTWWAGETSRIRLGCGVVNAAYWHPIRLAGEAAMLDLVSDGRLELGLGSGAYQREFDRMRPGLKREDGQGYLAEMLPLIRPLWEGDVAHEGARWRFPAATACPKPVQVRVPIWVAARSPSTFDLAAREGADLLCWPLSLPFAEAEAYAARRAAALEAAGPGVRRGRFAMMRHTAVYETEDARQAALGAVRANLARFGNLFADTGAVVDGFPEAVPLDALEGNARVDPAMLEQNLAFGSPDQVAEKVAAYGALGCDAFIYYASMGLGHAEQRRSLALFIEKVMPQIAAGAEAVPA